MVIAVMVVALSIWGLLYAWEALLSGLPTAATAFPGHSLLFALLKIALGYAGYWIGAGLMGPLTDLLEKIPPLRRLMRRSFNKRFNRYTAEGFNPRQHV